MRLLKDRPSLSQSSLYKVNSMRFVVSFVPYMYVTIVYCHKFEMRRNVIGDFDGYWCACWWLYSILHIQAWLPTMHIIKGLGVYKPLKFYIANYVLWCSICLYVHVHVHVHMYIHACCTHVYICFFTST